MSTNFFGVKFENEVAITVRDGKTGEVTFQYEDHNAISDDLDALKVQVARPPPPRAHVSRVALTLGASMWALIGFVAWLLAG